MHIRSLFLILGVIQTAFACLLFIYSFDAISFFTKAFLILTSFLFWFSFYYFRKTKIELEKKNLEQRTEKETVLNALMEGVVFVDPSLRIEYANFAATRILGSSKRLLEGKPFPEKKDSFLLGKVKELLLSSKKLNSPLTDSIVIEGERKTHFDLIALPQGNGNCALILQDKSSDHKALQVGKDFVASASHELKTPITIIRGFAETLQDMKDLPKEIVEDILEKILRNCHRMDTLVKNLLTLADIESVPLANTQYCDLESLVEECKRIVLSVYPNAEILVIKKSESITAEVEPSLLELAILNLIGNAVKYSVSPAEVTISMDQNPDEVQIEISDCGMGIPPSDLDHIFDRFYTVNKAHSRKLGGAGIGLSLVKTIIEKHEGTIQVSSTLGKGSTFTVTIPNYQHH